ncbi:MAG TPA: DUF5994 family protein [Actinospica sp.]|jgi:hypothetical protein|nr:DUF5994 family protein [Actinospica sp.]
MTATVSLPVIPVHDADLADVVDLREPTARILLKPPSEHPGMVNGAWWPRSRDLARELPLLISALDRSWGQIYHATVQVHMWPDIPKKVRAGRHILRVGWFDAEQDPHDICLISVPGRRRWDLLVVPPELAPAIAARLMATAASPGNMQTASSLVAAASARTAPSAGVSRDAERVTASESEGGAALLRPWQ